MPVETKELDGGKILEVHVSGKLSAQDYQHFVPEFERLVQQYGKLRVLFLMRDFHGWDAGGLWQDIKFDAKHSAHIERIAMIGDRAWQKGMAGFCKPFTTAKVHYFTPDQEGAAREWLGLPSAPPQTQVAA